MATAQLIILQTQLKVAQKKHPQKYKSLLTGFLQNMSKTLRKTDIQSYTTIEKVIQMIKTEEDCYESFVNALEEYLTR